MRRRLDSSPGHSGAPMKVQARGDNVILLPIEPPEKMSGLVLSEEEKMKWKARAVGLVLSVGPMVNDPLDADPIEEGQIVTFWGNHACLMEVYDRRTLFCIRAEFVSGIVLEDKPATVEEIARLKAQEQRI